MVELEIIVLVTVRGVEWDFSNLDFPRVDQELIHPAAPILA